MTDKYTGASMDRRYEGDTLDVHYSVKRCIHAQACVKGLAAVFDSQRRPWINANGATADETAQVIERCPSGALHYARKDGGEAEATPAENRVIVWHNGPLQLVGDLHIEGATVDVQEETRATLCRCGASGNKPFCDNSHKAAGFDGTTTDPITAVPNTAGGTLKVTITPDGPLHVEGAFTLFDENGQILMSGEDAWLCRCGGSANKPFCDGTHQRNGFTGA